MKLYTMVQEGRLTANLDRNDRLFMLGSCFSDEFSGKFSAAGFKVTSNPFGTSYNPLSILAAMKRLESAEEFKPGEIVRMGAGSELKCSFFHHSSYARKTDEEFLLNANEKLSEASSDWKNANKVIVTLGTAYVWRHGGEVVNNCLKRPGTEFTRERMSVEQVASAIKEMVTFFPDKEFIFTVSPIRHRGAHENALSKSALLLGVEEAGVCYFPAYEILMDELRDYRFYAEDLVHPSKTTVEIIWERFIRATLSAEDQKWVEENLKAAAFAAHRQITV